MEEPDITKYGKDYFLVKFDYHEVLFSNYGYLDRIRFSEMQLFRFRYKDSGFHILKVSPLTTLMFGRDQVFSDWLIEMGVPCETFDLKYLNVRKTEDKF